MVLVGVVVVAAGTVEAATIYDGNPVDSWSKWGHFEAGFTAYGRTAHAAAGASGVTGDKLAIEGRVTAWAKVFGTRTSFAEVRGSGYSYIDGSADYNAEVFTWLFGFKVRLHNIDWDPGSAIILEESFTRSFFSAETRFFAVVKVTGAVKGSIGYTAYGNASSTSLHARLTPEMRAYARFTASLDVWVAEGGAYGELNLMRLSVPMWTNVAFSGNCYTSQVEIERTLTKIYGSAGVYYRALWSDPKQQELWSTTPSQSTALLHDESTPSPVCL